MFKGSYRRNHEGDYLCTEPEIKTMIRDSLETSADSAVLDNVGLDALNSDSIKSYRSRFEIIRSGHTWNALPNDEFLIKIGAARVAEYDGKIHPTLGGLVFFGDFIKNSCPTRNTKTVSFERENRIVDGHKTTVRYIAGIAV